MRGFIAAGQVLIVVAAAGCGGGPGGPGGSAGGAAAVADAPVPAEHAGGRDLFDRSCASCHGPAASGTAQGPPLVHIYYEPRHHADGAFFLAVARGVRAHHWRYGDMPPMPGLSQPDVAAIVGYVRWLQRQAGIH